MTWEALLERIKGIMIRIGFQENNEGDYVKLIPSYYRPEITEKEMNTLKLNPKAVICSVDEILDNWLETYTYTLGIPEAEAMIRQCLSDNELYWLEQYSTPFWQWKLDYITFKYDGNDFMRRAKELLSKSAE